MHFLISSNFKKYFKTYIDFVDHYWIVILIKKIELQLPNSTIFNQIKKKIKLIILPGEMIFFPNPVIKNKTK